MAFGFNPWFHHGHKSVDFGWSKKAVNVNLNTETAKWVNDNSGHISSEAAMLTGENGYDALPLLTIGETIEGTSGAFNSSTAGDYTPTGVLDGIGAMKLDADTVRVFVNHEFGFQDGYAYTVNPGTGDAFSMTGARVSYLDIDIATKAIKDAGIAYDTIYDAAGNLATDTSFNAENGTGFNRFCSSQLVEAHQFGGGRGLEDTIYLTGEETGGGFSNTGGGMWALDVDSGEMWAVPAMGRGAWENVTEIDTGNTTHVAFILADDTSPFDADNDTVNEAAPIYMYVGEKNPAGDFLEQNGLSGGKLYVWVATDPTKTDPSNFNGSGTEAGSWVEIDNSTGTPSADGSTGFDAFGYPTQKNLWTQAKAAGAFQFSRPEDVSTNPADGSEIVLASTGRSSDFGGADRVGTVYSIDTDFSDIDNPTAAVKILYDGDADAGQALRSPDNLDWADDGYIYIQEDRAVNDLFGAGAVNPNEASIVKLDPTTGAITRVAHINRDAVVPIGATDEAPDDVANWESSGILDVSALFGEAPGSLFLADVQAHAIDDQNRFTSTGPAAAITDGNLKEGGQLLLISNDPDALKTPAVKEKDLSPKVKNVEGSKYDDSIYGDERNNRIEGGRGDDGLSGGPGHDNIDGGRGNDIIIPGTGNDRMSGGWGDDIFVFADETGRDKIWDFRPGHDKLDLTGVSGVDSFDDLTIVKKWHSTVIDLGDGNEIKLVGLHHDLGADDFIFAL
jgi:secreted PhoX family phosphatase